MISNKLITRFRLNAGRWNDTKNRSVNFAQLSPGDYRFEVQSQNEHGEWSKSNSVDFTIRPPFWQTAWFTALWIGVLFGAGWWYYRKRIAQILCL